MKTEITYDIEKFFNAVKATEEITSDRLSIREKVAIILQLAADEEKINSDMLKNIDLEDIEKAIAEVDSLDLEFSLSSEQNRNNTLADMILVEHAKGNLISVKPETRIKSRNLF